MNWSKSAVLLVVLLLVLAALIVRHLDLPAYSQEEVRQELSALCGEYAAMRQRRAAEAEWQSFEQRTREITQPIVADLEDPRYPSPLYQLARYDLPKAIASRGKIPDSSLQQQLRAHDELVAEMATSPQRRRDAQRRAGRYSNTREGDGGVDLLFVGAMLFDGVLLIAIGYMLFWPVRKHLFVPKDAESLLRQLDKRIERNPDSVRISRSVRGCWPTRAGRKTRLPTSTGS